MIQLIRRSTSWNNLFCRRHAAGQLSTLLILMTVIMLGFVLITANLGQISSQSTAVANAADTAALQLGSQLSSKASMLQKSLENGSGKNNAHYELWYGRPALCVNGGALPMVLAVVAAVVITVVSWGTLSWLGVTLVAGVGGAAAAGIGAAIIGTPVGTAMYHGLMVGMAIGSLGSGVYSAFLAPEAVGLGAGTTGISLGGTTWITVPTAVLNAATLTGSSLGVWGSLYNAGAYDRGVTQSLKALQEAFGRLNESDRIRESVMFGAMSQLVDDPNTSFDDIDINHNGDYREHVPNFYIWMGRRLKYLGDLQDGPAGVLNDFITGPLTNFRNFAYSTYAGQEYFLYGFNFSTVFQTHQPGVLESEEYLYFLIQNIVNAAAPAEEQFVVNTGNDGPLVKVLRGLVVGTATSTKYAVPSQVNPPNPIWVPGPTVADIQAVKDAVRDGLSPSLPPGYDEVDRLVDDMREAVSIAQGVLQAAPAPRTQNWKQWVPFFYDPNDDPNNPVTIYGKLGKYIEMVQGWKTTLDGVVATLPACQTDAGTGLLTNAPCTTGTALGSADADPDEDLQNMYLGLEFLLYNFESMRTSIENMWNDLQSSLQPGDLLATMGGKNPVEYKWTDRRGSQRVVVQIGDFTVPTTVEFKHGNWFSNEKCVELANFADVPGPGGRGCGNVEGGGTSCDQAWVKIWRYSQSPTSLGPMGMWNPFNRPVVKAASAHYDYRDVGLKNKS